MKPDLTIIAGAPDDAAEKPAGAASEQCVPLDALAMPDDADQMANPEPGDPVSYTVEGKVMRVSGDMAYVQPTAVNGKPVSEEKPGTPETDDESGMNDLQQAAEQQGYLG